LATAGYKDPGALLTIGELSQELGVAQHILRYWESKFPQLRPMHILRYWESKFPQLRPMQRAGNRRYYRPDDVELARRINRLLNHEGYTVRGVQKLLRDKAGEPEMPAPPAQPSESQPPTGDRRSAGVDVFTLIALRNSLQEALER
jgi:DNA-binding transcriptional MerR regulator